MIEYSQWELMVRQDRVALLSGLAGASIPDPETNAMPLPLPSDDRLRRASTRVVAALAARFGSEHLETVEDAVQDALLGAFKRAGHEAPPKDLTSWLYKVARNRVIDLLRRGARTQPLAGEHSTAGTDLLGDEIIQDAELRLLLMCCHPALSSTSRVALALSVAVGLTAPQIAGVLLMSEPGARQVIVRAKRRLRELGVGLEPRDTADLDARVESAMDTIYLMFSEGYFSVAGDTVVHPELCHEAVRLCGSLLDSPQTLRPGTQALAALLLFQMARLAARQDRDGDLIVLSLQDRSRWDARLIAAAFDLLTQSASGEIVTAYHLEAEIASYHARATSVEDTDWAAIVRAYDALARISPSPVVSLNRAVAVGELLGPAAGLAALDSLQGPDRERLEGYPFYHSVRGALLLRVGSHQAARAAFQRVLTGAVAGPLRRFAESHLGPMSNSG
jgi:RNA polymerase sigma-70 factor (ECF subfamily)